MKIQYCSDLHLEFPENDLLLRQSPLEIAGDILILSGDILPFKVMAKHSHFFDFVSDNYKAVYWVPGNHEYYGSDAADKKGEVKEAIRENVFLVNNTSITEGNTRLLFTTLWSYIQPQNEYYISRGLSDFKTIKFRGRTFTTRHVNILHHTCKTFLKDALSEKWNGPTIVATHHVPTMLNYPPQYKNSELNDAFVVEMYDLIDDTQPDYWIYGHHHVNVPEFKVGKTSMLTNQLGYVSAGEHGSFKRDASINI